MSIMVKAIKLLTYSLSSSKIKSIVKVNLLPVLTALSVHNKYYLRNKFDFVYLLMNH